MEAVAMITALCSNWDYTSNVSNSTKQLNAKSHIIVIRTNNCSLCFATQLWGIHSSFPSMLIVAKSVMDGLGLGLRTIFSHIAQLKAVVRWTCLFMLYYKASLYAHSIWWRRTIKNKRCNLSSDKRSKLNSKISPIHCISPYNQHSFSPNKSVSFDFNYLRSPKRHIHICFSTPMDSVVLPFNAGDGAL